MHACSLLCSVSLKSDLLQVPPRHSLAANPRRRCLAAAKGAKSSDCGAGQLMMEAAPATPMGPLRGHPPPLQVGRAAVPFTPGVWGGTAVGACSDATDLLHLGQGLQAAGPHRA